jgi:hypothetical protein
MTQPPRSVWYKKLILLSFPLLLALPIILLPLSFLFGGIYVYWSQEDLSHEDGKWRPLSAFELVTHTVDERLAQRLYFPTLSACQGANARLASERDRQGMSATEPSGAIRELCPNMSPLQYWLLYTASLRGLHDVVAPALQAVPVSLVMVLAAAAIAYLLGRAKVGT